MAWNPQPFPLKNSGQASPVRTEGWSNRPAEASSFASIQGWKRLHIKTQSSTCQKSTKSSFCYNHEEMHSVQKLKPKTLELFCILEAASRQGNVIGSLGIELGSLGLARVFNFWVAWLVPWCGTCMDIFAFEYTHITYLNIYLYSI